MSSQPGVDATRVSHDRLQRFLHDMAVRIGMPGEQAALLARLLIENDLRGVLTHGSRQMVRYATEIRSGRLNPRPQVGLVRETGNSVMMDGDGGLGHFPAYEGTLRLIEKAKEQGMAALVTRNHGHIGAAGTYTRLTAEHDLIAFATSGVQLHLKPDDTVYRAAGASPMSFSAPASDGPPLVFDAGVTHDLQGEAVHRDEIAHLAPGLALRAIGLGTICQAWGGLLTGLPIDAASGDRRYRSANQGGMLFAMKVSLFADADAFKREIDEYGRRTRRLTPIEGTEGAFLPGHVEAQREQAYRESGIPLSPDHGDHLRALAEELQVEAPF